MISRLGFRSLYGGVTCCRRLMEIPNGGFTMSVRRHSGGIPPQPFSNMPFRTTSRAATTLFFAVFFGLGLWAPLIIVWYSMAKKTM